MKSKKNNKNEPRDLSKVDCSLGLVNLSEFDAHLAAHIVRVDHASLETARTVYIRLTMNIIQHALVVPDRLGVLTAVTIGQRGLQTTVIVGGRVAPALLEHAVPGRIEVNVGQNELTRGRDLANLAAGLRRRLLESGVAVRANVLLAALGRLALAAALLLLLLDLLLFLGYADVDLAHLLHLTRPLSQTSHHGLHGLDVLFLAIAALVLFVHALQVLLVLGTVELEIFLFQIGFWFMGASRGAHDIARQTRLHPCQAQHYDSVQNHC
jgi:hypothetical protein